MSRSEATQQKRFLVLDRHWQLEETILLDIGPRYHNVAQGEDGLPAGLLEDVRPNDRWACDRAVCVRACVCVGACMRACLRVCAGRTELNMCVCDCPIRHEMSHCSHTHVKREPHMLTGLYHLHSAMAWAETESADVL